MKFTHIQHRKQFWHQAVAIQTMILLLFLVSSFGGRTFAIDSPPFNPYQAPQAYDVERAAKLVLDKIRKGFAYAVEQDRAAWLAWYDARERESVKKMLALKSGLTGKLVEVDTVALENLNKLRTVADEASAYSRKINVALKKAEGAYNQGNFGEVVKILDELSPSSIPRMGSRLVNFGKGIAKIGGKAMSAGQWVFRWGRRMFLVYAAIDGGLTTYAVAEDLQTGKPDDAAAKIFEYAFPGLQELTEEHRSPYQKPLRDPNIDGENLPISPEQIEHLKHANPKQPLPLGYKYDSITGKITDGNQESTDLDPTLYDIEPHL